MSFFNFTMTMCSLTFEVNLKYLGFNNIAGTFVLVCWDFCLLYSPKPPPPPPQSRCSFSSPIYRFFLGYKYNMWLPLQQFSHYHRFFASRKSGSIVGLDCYVVPYYKDFKALIRHGSGPRHGSGLPLHITGACQSPNMVHGSCFITLGWFVQDPDVSASPLHLLALRR